MVKEVVSCYKCLSDWTRIINRRWLFKGGSWLPICYSIIHVTEKLAKSSSSSSKGNLEAKVWTVHICSRRKRGWKLYLLNNMSSIAFQENTIRDQILLQQVEWNQIKYISTYNMDPCCYRELEVHQKILHNLYRLVLLTVYHITLHWLMKSENKPFFSFWKQLKV